MEKIVQNFIKHIQSHLGNQDIHFKSFDLIAGDASDRKFYRLILESPQKTLSFIAMSFGKGGFGGDLPSWKNLHHDFSSLGVPTPTLYSEEVSFLWIQDLGETFLKTGKDFIGSSNLDDYQKSIEILWNLQSKADQMPKNSLIFQRYFDYEKLWWEIEFLEKHFIQGYLGEELPSQVKEELKALCVYLDQRPRTLCHRDYHSKNIMLFETKAYWIDFQDARCGPYTYDLVSLLKDSYIKFDEQIRYDLFMYYLKGLKEVAPKIYQEVFPSLEIAIEEFHFMGLQRNLKNIASFAYLAREKGKEEYLKFIPYTLSILFLDPKVWGYAAQKKFPYTYDYALKLKDYARLSYQED